MLKQQYQSTIVQTISNLLIPFIQLYAIYVIIHGHYGPGGGFQGGVLLAVSIILQRICCGSEVSYRKFSPEIATMFAAVGILIFGIVGVIPMIFGAAFLDYSSLPIIWVHGAELRYLGILIVEIGIGLAVFGTLVLIFDYLGGEQGD